MPALSLLVLGTGGPFVQPPRVSSGYVLYVDGVARVLLDPGGGTFERLGRFGVDLGAIDLVLYTHTHIDHTGGIPPAVFAMYMGERKRAFRIAGPCGRDQQPSCTRFVDLLFGRDGAWAYMNTFEGFAACAQDLPSDPDHEEISEVEVPEIERLRIRSVAVPHGMMPAVAYRFDYDNASLAFSGDIARAHAPFIRLSHHVGVLLHDLALPQRDVPHGHLHAKPLEIGSTAAETECRELVVTHFLPEIEDELADAIELIRTRYSGIVRIAQEGELLSGIT
jgi:ribonuclease BN (tRNA processing enzyme)